MGSPRAVRHVHRRICEGDVSSLQLLGSCAASGITALRLARELDIDLVVLAGSAAASPRLRRMLAAAPAEVVSCGAYGGYRPDAELVELGGATGVRLLGRPLRPAQRRAKSLFDRIAALLLLVLFAPLLVAIAALIKLDSPGPVLYRQRRHGLGLAEFAIVKFRTLHVRDCAPADAVTVQVEPGDRRVTRVGRLLRKTSLDELPQLLNVLQGSMSLVGPRPYPLDFLRTYADAVPRYLERHRVVPGITGRAQVFGYCGSVKSVEEMQRRTLKDLAYIARWSFRGDIAILLRSVGVMFGGRRPA